MKIWILTHAYAGCCEKPVMFFNCTAAINATVEAKKGMNEEKEDYQLWEIDTDKVDSATIFTVTTMLFDS